MRALGVAVAVAALAGVGLAQDGAAKKESKERLPFFWNKLELSDEQKSKYLKIAETTEKQKDALTTEIDKAAAKLRAMRAEYKKLDSGEQFEEAVLNAAQRTKLKAMKADAAERSADKSAKKAKKLKGDAAAAPGDTAKPKDAAKL
jgi:hypothetical protein